MISPSSALVDIVWHLPEVEWHEATVALRQPTATSGRPIVLWQIDGDYRYPDFTCDWSSDRYDDLELAARIRVRRHDGPRRIAVRVTDDDGAHYTSVFSRNPR